MTRLPLAAVGCATLLWAATALGDAQENCDRARVGAWRTYLSCLYTIVAKDYAGAVADSFIEEAAFARCRHAYFRKWRLWQNPRRRPSLKGSTCIGTRFTDDGNQTVTDKLSALVWEKKDNLDNAPNYSDPHDADNHYTWSTGSPYNENGTAFTDFLGMLNSATGFAGSNGWRLPTFVELQTTVLDFACKGELLSDTCTCLSDPCVDPAFDAPNTSYDAYWSSTTLGSALSEVWIVDGLNEDLVFKTYTLPARAVRGGW